MSVGCMYETKVAGRSSPRAFLDPRPFRYTQNTVAINIVSRIICHCRPFGMFLDMTSQTTADRLSRICVSGPTSSCDIFTCIGDADPNKTMVCGEHPIFTSIRRFS
jgi:hypothetical protein